jgi:hypothetical protein
MFGMNTYVGYNKHDFPICIVNPIKTNFIKSIILKYVQTLNTEQEEIKVIKYTETYEHKYNKDKYKTRERESFEQFFGKRDCIKDFDIISVAESVDGIAIDKSIDSFLLRQKENPEKKCVVIINKKTKKIVRFGF